MKKLYILLLLFLPFCTIEAQDIHYTQYNLSPMSLNPAFAGQFEGTFRIGAIYRDQWFNLSGFEGSYKTPNIFIDAPLKGFRDNHWIGVGANIFQDKVGSLEMTFGSFLGNVAYHIGLNKDMTRTISFGVQGGYVSRRLANSGEARFEDQLADMVDDNAINYFDISSGIVFRTPLGQNSLLEMGVSAFHLLGPDYSILKKKEKLPLRYDLHARWKNYVNNEFTITPSLLYKGMNSNNELSLQLLAGFTIDPEKDIDFNAGLGYRFGDAAELLVGVDWGNFRAGIGYDLNVSSLASDSGSRPGAFELAVSYVARIFKKPEPKPTIFCPRF